MKIEIEKNLVVSTAHVYQSDMERLADIVQSGLSANDPSFVIAYDSEYWTMVLVAGQKVPIGFSDAFIRVFEFAKSIEKSEGITFLKLDADGPILDGFETFDW